MSQENVEIVRRYLEAATRRLAVYWRQPRSVVEAMQAGELDTDSAEMLAQLCEDIQWTNAMGDTYQGKLACAKGVDELLGASDAYSVSVEEVSELDGEHVLASLRSRMRGRSSGAAVTIAIFSLYTMRDGLIARIDECLTRDAALKAVGLEE